MLSHQQLGIHDQTDLMLPTMTVMGQVYNYRFILQGECSYIIQWRYSVIITLQIHRRTPLSCGN